MVCWSKLFVDCMGCVMLIEREEKKKGVGGRDASWCTYLCLHGMLRSNCGRPMRREVTLLERWTFLRLEEP